IKMLDRKNLVAWPDECEQRRRDRRHAASEAERIFGAFELGDLLLESADGRIETAGIGWASNLARKSRRHFVIGREGEERSLKDRRHDRVAVLPLVMGDDRRRSIGVIDLLSHATSR